MSDGGMGSGGGKSLTLNLKSTGRTVHLYFYPHLLTPEDKLTDGAPSAGNDPFEIRGNTSLIWIDLAPEARFVHPTAYLLVSDSDSCVKEGGWWPVLNGEKILYGLSKPIIADLPSGIEI